MIIVHQNPGLVSHRPTNQTSFVLKHDRIEAAYISGAAALNAERQWTNVQRMCGVQGTVELILPGWDRLEQWPWVALHYQRSS